MGEKPLVERRIVPVLREALRSFRVVILHGPRQAGKTTAAIQAAGAGSYVSLDDHQLRSAAVEDPMGLLQSLSAPAVIDEVQRAGEPLVRAVKQAVDRSRTPGQFLLIGSADFLTVPTISESLAGRAVLFRLLPFSQGEIEGRREAFLEGLARDADSPPPGRDSDLSLGSCLHRICAGGFPEVQGLPPGARNAWFGSYVNTVTLRDVVALTGARRADQLPRLLQALAARTAGELVVSNVHGDVGLGSVLTTADYLAHLQMVHLVHELQPWSRNLTSRAKRRPKIYVTDTGLAAALMKAPPDALSRPGHPGRGPLMETFAVNEIMKQADWLDPSLGSVGLFHYRDRNGLEVDLIIELPDGRAVAVEGKAAAAVHPRDWSNLAKLRDLLGNRFAQGIVLYTGSRALPAGDRISVRPIEALWQS